MKEAIDDYAEEASGKVAYVEKEPLDWVKGWLTGQGRRKFAGYAKHAGDLEDES